MDLTDAEFKQIADDPREECDLDTPTPAAGEVERLALVMRGSDGCVAILPRADGLYIRYAAHEAAMREVEGRLACHQCSGSGEIVAAKYRYKKDTPTKPCPDCEGGKTSRAALEVTKRQLSEAREECVRLQQRVASLDSQLENQHANTATEYDRAETAERRAEEAVGERVGEYHIHADDDTGENYWSGGIDGDKDEDRLKPGQPLGLSPKGWPVGTIARILTANQGGEGGK